MGLLVLIASEAPAVLMGDSLVLSIVCIALLIEQSCEMWDSQVFDLVGFVIRRFAVMILS